MPDTFDIGEFNRRWLAGWTAKDVDGLLAFYTPSTRFFGPAEPAGVTGLDALRRYLETSFAGQPPITYAEDESWPVPGGYCARWYATIETPAGPRRLRGFDFVLLEDGLIAHNEVYIHNLPPG
ncbi:nuclear transport factor 2 family protein [Novosphingobium bradum]|uniref:Nuclear transport factor 2 family protein n=1 Tax=Novosphingobium bradum TaxID=1737444 RepID=A0ABV7IPC5_9SPHN